MDKVFKAGYIERTIVEPTALVFPVVSAKPEVKEVLPEAEEKKPEEVPKVAAEIKEAVPSWVPWAFAGVSMLFAILAMSKGGK